MDNWIISILVNVVLVIALGIFTNILTPYVKSTIDKSIFASKKRRIKAIKVEYEAMKSFNEDDSRLILIAILGLAIGIIIALLAVLAFLLSWSLFVLTPNDTTGIITQIVFSGFWIFFSIRTIIVTSVIPYLNIARFSKFREKTIKKLEKLGATLDEEELERNPVSGG